MTIDDNGKTVCIDAELSDVVVISKVKQEKYFDIDGKTSHIGAETSNTDAKTSDGHAETIVAGEK
jgi:hypothetical protein